LIFREILFFRIKTIEKKVLNPREKERKKKMIERFYNIFNLFNNFIALVAQPLLMQHAFQEVTFKTLKTNFDERVYP